MSTRTPLFSRIFRMSPQKRDHILVTIWILITFRQFTYDELLLYPLALYFFWSFVREFRQVFELIAQSYVLWLFPIWWFLSLAWGAQTEMILKSGLQLLLTLMICYCAVLRLQPRQMMLSVFIAATIVGLGSFLFDPMGTYSYTGIFRSKNALGSAMVILWISALCTALDTGFSRSTRLIALAAIPLSLWMIQIAHSATATLLAIGAFGLVIFLRFRVLLSRKVTICLLSLATGLALAGGCYLAIHVVEIDPVRQLLRAVGKDTTLTGRTVLWEYATVEIREHPLLGVGHGGFWTPEDPFSVARRIFDEFYKRYNASFSFHSSYYEIAVHQGLIGLGLVVISTVWTILRVLPVAFFAREMWAIFFSCIALINTAISFTEVALMVPFKLLFMLFTIGALLTLKRRPAPLPAATPAPAPRRVVPA